jgi:2-oxoglutarate ferredoxin oxidoreductase subunit alpha
VEDLAAQGVRAALFRPVSLYPFPYDALRKAAEKARAILVVELSTGQMVEDVRLAVQGSRPVRFYGRQGGMLASPEEVAEQIRALAESPAQEVSHG